MEEKIYGIDIDLIGFNPMEMTKDERVKFLEDIKTDDDVLEVYSLEEFLHKLNSDFIDTETKYWFNC